MKKAKVALRPLSLVMVLDTATVIEERRRLSE